MGKNYIKDIQKTHQKALINARKMSKQEVRDIFNAIHKYLYSESDNPPFKSDAACHASCGATITPGGAA